jgi:hypothetical protein
MQMSVSDVLASHLWALAETVHRLGHDRPEEVDGSDHVLVGRMLKQRARVARAIEGNDPDAVARQVEALTKGLGIVLKRYTKEESPC